MEENTSMFNNKIIGILVAVIVTATVLVPICNALSTPNSQIGNNEPIYYSEDAGEVYYLKSTRYFANVDEIGVSFYAEDYNVGDIVWCLLDGTPMIQVIEQSGQKMFEINLLVNERLWAINEVDRKYAVDDWHTQGWGADVDYIWIIPSFEYKYSSHASGNSLLSYEGRGLIDYQGWYYIDKSEIDDDCWALTLSNRVIFKDFDQFLDSSVSLKIYETYYYEDCEMNKGIVTDYDESFGWEVWGTGNIDVDWRKYEDLSEEEYINLMNNPVKNGLYLSAYNSLYYADNELNPITFNGKSMVFSPHLEYEIGDVPTNNTPGNSGNDNSVVSTIIGIIPVFVFLAIFGMIAKMLFDRKIANQ